MRKGFLFALTGAAMLAFVGTSNASPLSASAATNGAVLNSVATDGFTEVQYKRHHRHGWRHHHRHRHSWHRGRHHHHGWRHRHHRHVYGYHPYRGSGVYIRIR